MRNGPFLQTNEDFSLLCLSVAGLVGKEGKMREESGGRQKNEYD